MWQHRERGATAAVSIPTWSFPRTSIFALSNTRTPIPGFYLSTGNLESSQQKRSIPVNLSVYADESFYQPWDSDSIQSVIITLITESCSLSKTKLLDASLSLLETTPWNSLQPILSRSRGSFQCSILMFDIYLGVGKADLMALWSMLSTDTFPCNCYL